ncbi:MAG: YigZ family protein [Anaerolineae bacterium]
MTYKRPLRDVVIHELEVEKSRFITRITRAETVEEARSFIHEVRALEPTASHHVYAYCIGFGNSTIYGMSDAGEPAGTAGRPTLAVLQGSQLGDVVLVTTRYFGGRKLGTGGLVRAYTQAAQQALALCAVEEKVQHLCFTMLAQYTHYSLICHTLARFGAEISATDFATDVSISFSIRPELWPDCETALINTAAGSIVLIPC